MTECTSHLVGLWIGAAISNTSHSKQVLPLSNEHGSQVKDQGRWQCCQIKHKKFPYRPTCDVSLLLDPPHKCLWLFDGNNCYANAPQCYVYTYCVCFVV